jgi:hypothetical protein
MSTIVRGCVGNDAARVREGVMYCEIGWHVQQRSEATTYAVILWSQFVEMSLDTNFLSETAM